MEFLSEMLVQNEQIIEKDIGVKKLTIKEGGKLKAPEGKYLTVLVNGIVLEPEEETYEGEIELLVRENFTRSTTRFGEETISNYQAAVIVNDGNVVLESSVLPAVQNGSITNDFAKNITIEAREWDFNGFYITGDTEYEIDNANIHLVGDGTDDFVGLGSAIAAAGNTKLFIRNTKVFTEGIGRGTLFCGGNSVVTVEDSELKTESYVPTKEQMEAGKKLDRMMEPPWSIGIRGNGRALNLAECGSLNLLRSHVTSNSWGVLSVDGARVNRMNIKDSVIELIGENGYGCFCICDDLMFDYDAFGEPGCIDTIDHSVFNVAYTGILMSLGNGMGEFKNHSIVNSKRFGAFVHRNNGGRLKINSGSIFHTEDSCIVVKGSNTYFELDNAIMEPENGVILQLMDNDDVGMCDDPFLVPVGEKDTRDDRDLTIAIPDEDIFMTLSNMEARGDFLNSTTDLMACNKKLPGAKAAAPAPPNAEKLRGFIGDTLMGAKNLDMKLINTKVTGAISAAEAEYNPGVTLINYDNFEELSRIKQTPAKPINNGVIVSIDKNSTWNVTRNCYITKLVLEEGGEIQKEGKGNLKMIVDGIETTIKAGTYTGIIEFVV